MLWFPKNLPPAPVFLGNSTWGTRCCPNMVLTWVVFVLRSMQPARLWLRLGQNHLYSLWPSKCRTTDYQSRGLLALWKAISGSIAALLMFSSLHSYKPITSLSHVPLTIPSVSKFPFLLCFVSVHLTVASTETIWWKKTSGEKKKKLHTHCFNFNEVTVIRTKKRKKKLVQLGWQHSWGNQLGLVVDC